MYIICCKESRVGNGYNQNNAVLDKKKGSFLMNLNVLRGWVTKRVCEFNEVANKLEVY